MNVVDVETTLLPRGERLIIIIVIILITTHGMVATRQYTWPWDGRNQAIHMAM